MIFDSHQDLLQPQKIVVDIKFDRYLITQSNMRELKLEEEISKVEEEVTIVSRGCILVILKILTRKEIEIETNAHSFVH